MFSEAARRMDETRVLFAIAESCPLDALLVKEMRRSVNSLLQLNLRRFRIPQKMTTHYSALDVMKQALELLFEFSPSERNYREAMRTIQVYSEGDKEMFSTLRACFSLIANAVYNAFSGQRHAEAFEPDIMFLQGIPFEKSELEQAFRYVGVKPPELTPHSVKITVFLDNGFEAYRHLLEGELACEKASIGREEHWARIIGDTLTKNAGKALIRAGAEHVDQPRSSLKTMMTKLRASRTGRLRGLLNKKGITLQVNHRTEDINEIFGEN
jgi:hypothetical protein